LRRTGFFNNGNTHAREKEDEEEEEEEEEEEKAREREGERVARIFTSLSRPLYSLNRLPHMATLMDIMKLYLAARGSIVRSNVNETGFKFQ